MTASSKAKVAPAESFKRALGLCVRAIAGDEEVQVGFGPGRPELDGKSVSLPEPSRVPSRREISVIRGWAEANPGVMGGLGRPVDNTGHIAQINRHTVDDIDDQFAKVCGIANKFPGLYGQILI